MPQDLCVGIFPTLPHSRLGTIVGVFSLTAREVNGARGLEKMRVVKKGVMAAALVSENFMLSLHNDEG